MATKKKTTATKNNTVKLVGYLKENTLEQITNTRGDQVIRGSLIIATDKINSHKVQFYVAETTSSGEESKDFVNLSALLPTNTITIASFLKENPEADFETAANASSKIWAMARLDEYASRSGERVRSIVSLRGFRAGFSKASSSPFTTCAEFNVDVYINNIAPEFDGTEETGRVLIEGLIPKYNGSVDKVDFVAVAEDGIADYIGRTYSVGDTVNLNGDVVNITERILVDSEGDDNHFGRAASGPQYETKFIHELRICGGSKNPLKDGDEGAITAAEARDGLAAREVKMTENGAKAAERAKASPNPAPAKPTRQADSDLDF